MEPIDILSDTLMDILKEFSIGKRPLTATTLKEALTTKEEIISLLRDGFESTGNGISRYRSFRDRSPALQADSEAAMEAEIEWLEEFRNLFLQILDGLAPVISGEYEKRFSMLQEKIHECKFLTPLIMLGEQIKLIVGELVNDAVDRMQFSNDFLVELGKDLLRIEEHLISYQIYNRETHQINNEFNDNVSSHTNDVFCAVDSGTNLKNIHNLIITKLGMISKSIETKRQSDEIRLREADTRIAELQDHLKTYEFEISQVKERSESLEKEVLLDELTRINNRRAYDLQIRDNLRHYHRSGKVFSIVLIDIDHFKRVNDNYGHKAGDKCLKEVASLIKSSLRKTDFLARYGGEELIAILNGSDIENALKIAEKIRNSIQEAGFYFQGEKLPITISLGVTEIIHSDTEPEAPFIRVDEAMYRAKKNGRNRVCANTEVYLPISGTTGSKTGVIPT